MLNKLVERPNSPKTRQPKTEGHSLGFTETDAGVKHYLKLPEIYSLNPLQLANNSNVTILNNIQKEMQKFAERDIKRLKEFEKAGFVVPKTEIVYARVRPQDNTRKDYINTNISSLTANLEAEDVYTTSAKEQMKENGIQYLKELKTFFVDQNMDSNPILNHIQNMLVGLEQDDGTSVKLYAQKLIDDMKFKCKPSPKDRDTFNNTIKNLQTFLHYDINITEDEIFNMVLPFLRSQHLEYYPMDGILVMLKDENMVRLYDAIKDGKISDNHKLYFVDPTGHCNDGSDISAEYVCKFGEIKHNLKQLMQTAKEMNEIDFTASKKNKVYFRENIGITRQNGKPKLCVIDTFDGVSVEGSLKSTRLKHITDIISKIKTKPRPGNCRKIYAVKKRYQKASRTKGSKYKENGFAKKKSSNNCPCSSKYQFWKYIRSQERRFE